MKLICPVFNKYFLKFLPAWRNDVERNRLDKKSENDKKNVVDNLKVFVEFNQCYKLLLVSCLLGRRKSFFFTKYETYVGWINLIERNRTKQLFGR